MNATVPAFRLLLALGLAGAAAVAVAATGESSSEPSAKRSAPDATNASFELLDSNHDGQVSAPELGTWLRVQGDRSKVDTATLGARALARHDHNRDGLFTLADQRPAPRTIIEFAADENASRVAAEGGDDDE